MYFQQAIKTESIATSDDKHSREIFTHRQPSKWYRSLIYGLLVQFILHKYLKGLVQPRIMSFPHFYFDLKQYDWHKNTKSYFNE